MSPTKEGGVLTLRVALLQLDYPAGETKSERVARVTGVISDAPDADLLVLPELWDVGYFAFDTYEREAEALSSGPLRVLGDRASARGSTLVAGSVLERAGGDLFNTIGVVGPDGAHLGRYRKMHLFGHESEEAQRLSAGDETVVVRTQIGQLGLATCFDLRFPEQFAAMRSDGADLFVVPAAWPAARAEHWRVLVQARAIETQTPLVAVNGVGPCVGVDLAGSSLVVDARGTVLLEAGTTPGWHVTEIDLADTAAWRREFPLRGDASG